jgi:hypothetical protein
VNAYTFHVLRTSAAYFADTSTWGPKTPRYIIFGGLAVKDLLLPSSPSVQNITEAIPAFTDLELKDLKNTIVLLNGIYWNRQRAYWAKPLELKV